jgi:hypothetical protein
MPEISMREQLLVSFMFLLVFVLVGMWGIQQLSLQQNNLLLQLDKQELQIRQIRSHSSEWDQLRRTPTAPVMPQALSSFVENVARSLEIQDNLQLNVLTNVQKGTEGVKVGLDRLKLDQLLSMLYQLENHRPVLRTSHLSISISPGNRQVRASFQVHKQQEG